MKKYIPLIILALISIMAYSCRQPDIMDEAQPSIIQPTDNRKDGSEKVQDTIIKDITPAADPPVKDTHDWKSSTNNP